MSHFTVTKRTIKLVGNASFKLEYFEEEIEKVLRGLYGSNTSFYSIECGNLPNTFVLESDTRVSAALFFIKSCQGVQCRVDFV